MRDFLLNKIAIEMQNFREAVEDSEAIKRIARQNIRPRLKNLSDKNIIWNQEHTAVLVVSFIPVGIEEKIYIPAAEKSATFTTPSWQKENTIYCWVTFVPEVKNFGIKYINDMKLFKEHQRGSAYIKDRIALTDRINQYLGLIPFSEDYNAHDVRAVEMWVRPDDLFRPCENPSPYAKSCSLRPEKPLIEPNFDHKLFLEAKENITWTLSPFPWTNWGFSYDWGPDAAQYHIGATEFAIKPNSKVIFNLPTKNPYYDFASLEKYCREVPTPQSGTVSVPMPQ